MCYSKGPLLSPRLFKEFMVPRYKKVTDLLRSRGVTINIVDCDGRITDLVPLWLEAGINCMLPVEARHTDIYELREKFGKQVLLMGGVDKFALMKGPEAIDAELKRLTPLLEEGGYIPMVDHRVPPEVSLENYRYYLRKKRKWIGREA
jgi:uroporphyrinogen decarboxylase